jgi:hypothetical protein
MKKSGMLLPAIAFAAFAPVTVRAQNAYAPELYGVNEVVVDEAYFSDPKAAASCNLTKEGISSLLKYAFAGKDVPAIPAAAARPTTANVARIKLIPEIASHVDDNLGCISWVSLSAESRATVIIPPVSAPREETILYWRLNSKVASSLTSHPQKISEALRMLADRFAQQYTHDQRNRVAR